MIKRLLLRRDGGDTVLPKSAISAESVTVPGECPYCASKTWRVAGQNKRISHDDIAYEADAIALCCGGAVGVLRAETNTLFGLREDEALSRFGIRIY